MQMQSITTYKVKHLDLEEFIHAKYGMEFDYIKATGRAYPDCVEYLVSGKLIDTESVRNQIAKVRQGRWVPNVALLLNLLCFDEHIRPGKYVVVVQRITDLQDWYLKLLENYGVDSEECRHFRDQYHKTQIRSWFERVDRNVRRFYESN